ncbi:hypothetical protein Vadar_019060 [Vaccinium darrowii]|uniref:Uncharacterized protein n=1 Tax=Vaccinium darrowii TaxID=229202 RepID=A0ACB7Y1R5_9ERIC|nr:hypothetical protein Vadar_019060 [Vaccinium darrowii]
MDGLITVYVNNLHRDMDVIWLRQIFSSCGRVADVFIPSKKSKSFNTKFGSIRFKRREEALRAINDLNGLFIRGLRITKAMDRVATESVWLQNIAVGILINYCYVNTLQDLFISNGIWDAHIRPLGGLNVLVSFDSVELLDTFLEDKDNVLPKWFSSMEAWKDQSFKPSRCVWISCYGVLLKAWCSSTFTNIGKLWGDVIRLDELTEKLIAFDKGRLFMLTDYLDCINELVHVKINDTIYPVKVVEDLLAETSCEKRVFTSIKIKNGDNLIGKDAIFEMVEVEHEDDVSCDLNVPGPLGEKVCLSSWTTKNDMEFEPCNHSTDVGNHFSVSRDVDSFVGESKYSPGNEAVDVEAQTEGKSIEEGVKTTSSGPIDSKSDV